MGKIIFDSIMAALCAAAALLVLPSFTKRVKRIGDPEVETLEIMFWGMLVVLDTLGAIRWITILSFDLYFTRATIGMAGSIHQVTTLVRELIMGR